MKDKCDLLDNQTSLIKSQQSMIEDMKENLTNLAKATSNLEENFSTGKLKETNQIKSSMGLFTRSVKLAFKTEKALLRNAKRPLRNNEMVTKMIKDELEAVKGDTKDALEKIKANMTNMQININEVSDIVRSTGKTLETLDTTFTYTCNLQKLNSTIALLETKVEDNRERIVEISECCSRTFILLYYLFSLTVILQYVNICLQCNSMFGSFRMKMAFFLSLIIEFVRLCH